MTDRFAPMQPGEVLDFRIKTDELLASGETIVEADSGVVVTGADVDGALAWNQDDVTVRIDKDSAALGTLIKVAATFKASSGNTYRRSYFIPFGEPVSMELVKQHIRIEQTNEAEDLALAQYIRAAREWVEKYTGHVLVRRSFSQHFACFGASLELWRRPIAAVSEIAYSDSDGDPQTYADFVAVVSRHPARIWPALNGSWPSALDRDGVLVSYVAGYPEGEAPETLCLAILMLVAHWYNVREAVNVGNIVTDVPFGVKALVDQYRTPVL